MLWAWSTDRRRRAGRPRQKNTALTCLETGGSGDRALLEPQKTKPLAVVAVGGPEPVAVGDTHETRNVEPATTPADTIGGLTCQYI